MIATRPPGGPGPRPRLPRQYPDPETECRIRSVAAARIVAAWPTDREAIEAGVRLLYRARRWTYQTRGAA